MHKNLGILDRSLRIAMAVIIGILYLSGILPNSIGVISIVIAIMLLLTSFIGSCPVYSFLGLRTSTNSRKNNLKVWM